MSEPNETVTGIPEPDAPPIVGSFNVRRGYNRKRVKCRECGNVFIRHDTNAPDEDELEPQPVLCLDCSDTEADVQSSTIQVRTKTP